MSWLVGIKNPMDMSLSKPQEVVKNGEAWCAAFPAVSKVRHDLVSEQQQEQITDKITKNPDDIKSHRSWHLN